MLALKLANSLVSYGEAKQNIYALNFDGTDESVNMFNRNVYKGFS